MKNTEEFAKRQNIELLWDVLLDELCIDVNNKQLTGNIRVVFEKNISPFVARANPNANLIELNKTFLKQLIVAINKLFPSMRNIKKIQIGDEFSDKPYKIEDIHSARQSDFEKQLEQKRHDFEVTMNPSKPNDMDFSDKFQETKITSMDALIAETVAKRNFDLEQVQYANYNTTTQPSDWLSAKETSVKSEKQQQYENVQREMQKTKYLQPQGTAFPESVSSQPNQKGNNVSWDEENISFEIQEQQQERSDAQMKIFSKLKRISPQEEEKETVAKEIADMKEEMMRLNKNIEKMMEMFVNMNNNTNGYERNG